MLLSFFTDLLVYIFTVFHFFLSQFCKFIYLQFPIFLVQIFKLIKSKFLSFVLKVLSWKFASLWSQSLWISLFMLQVYTLKFSWSRAETRGDAAAASEALHRGDGRFWTSRSVKRKHALADKPESELCWHSQRSTAGLLVQQLVHGPELHPSSGKSNWEVLRIFQSGSGPWTLIGICRR